jgi:uncharacterized protein DUF4157/lysine-specific metallo-endopeptidase family protein
MVVHAAKKKSKPAVTPTKRLHAQLHEGQHANVRSILHSGRVQPKLQVGQPNDKYEQEADRIADQVVNMPETSAAHNENYAAQSQLPLPRIQRACPECEEELQRQEEEEELQFKPLAEQIAPLVQNQVEPKEEPLQTGSLSNHTNAISSTIEQQINTVRNGGRPMPESVRRYFEPRFGSNFSHVRLHTGSHAAATTQAVNAKAFTLGNDIFFNSRQYSPQTHSGKKLLAHELTHVIQQQSHSGNKGPLLQRFPVGPFDVRGNGDIQFEAMIARWLHSLNGTGQGNALFQALETNRGDQGERIGIEPHRFCHVRRERGLILPGPDIIYFNVWGCLDPTADMCPGEGEAPLWMAVPRYINLFHECVHVYLNQAGRRTDPQRECMATGLGNYFTSIPYNENRLRCELGLPVRPCYNGDCPELGPPTCSALGEQMIQPKMVSGHTENVNSNIESRIRSTSGKGQPLPTSTRVSFESRFNHDFSQVRVHTDNNSNQLNRELNAQAFTVNKDIYFNLGKYDTGSYAGKRLLAHELTHVVQQGSGDVVSRDMVQKTGGRDLPAPLTDDEWIEVVQSALAGAQAMLNSAVEIAQQAENSVPQPVRSGTTANRALHSTQLIETWFGSASWEHVQSIRETYERLLETVNTYNRTTFTVVSNADVDNQGSSDAVAYVNAVNPEQGIFLANRFFGRSDEDELVMVSSRNREHQARTLVHEIAHFHILHSGHAGGEFPDPNFACNEGLGLTYRQAIQNPYAWDHFAFCAQGGILPSSPGRLEALIQEIQQRRQP